MLSEPLIRVSLVEDNDAIRENVALLIESDPGFECASHHANAADALRKLAEVKPDVVIMDINLPDASGIACVRKLKPALPRTQFVMFTIYEDSERIFESLLAGATGYLLKRNPSAELLAAIREVHRGGSPMTSEIARKVVQLISRRDAAKTEFEKLSPRELQVLDGLARGQAYKQIADVLGLSIDTVRKHIRGIYEKLQVHCRTDAVVKYLQR
ncbi:MAG: response regulator transcription factor [Verrucomicrobiota bacterium]